MGMIHWDTLRMKSKRADRRRSMAVTCGRSGFGFERERRVIFVGGKRRAAVMARRGVSSGRGIIFNVGLGGGPGGGQIDSESCS